MTIPVWGLLPFVAMLLCIAVAPLVPALAHHWERPRNQLVVALALGVPVALWMILGGEPSSVVHAGFEYFQFISLLLALFVVSGGIHLGGDIEASPRNNTIFLAIGGVIASFIGTTGAAMLLIRPILQTNRQRRHVAHTVVFAIFVVANCGGLLTPLGDPPLFLGMLRGVPFTWTLHLVPEWALTNGLLLLTYHALDRRLHATEYPTAVRLDKTQQQPLRVHGAVHFAFFAIIIVAVAVVPSVDLHAIEAGHATWSDWLPLRELCMLLAAGLSLTVGSTRVRYELNRFVWAPILEVAALFIGIFLTMIPALKYLEEIAPKLPLDEVTFYWITGGLSSFLDNAPTYATFFSIAAQLPGEPRIGFDPGVPEHYLVAISVGAVFFGAMTYIGNGPNFMVKSVAESAGVRMPSFGGYLWWSARYLLPILVAVCGLFVAQTTVWHVIGALAAAFVLGRAIWLWLRPATASA